MDVETQNIFDLLHHYESDCWGLPAPTEGRVIARSSADYEVSRSQIEELPVIGELVVSEEGNVSGVT